MKRTPLKRSNKPIKRVSAKQRKREKAFKAAPKPEWCELCECNPAEEADHVLQRSTWPEWRDDPVNSMWLCHLCHIWVTNQPHVKWRVGMDHQKIEEIKQERKQERKEMLICQER